MKKRFLLTILVLIAVVLWGFFENTALALNEITVASGDLPENFSGFRIAHISDLHNTSFGENNERLLELLRSAQPDIIAITGDLIDSRNTDIDVAAAFAAEAAKIAPCYYVTGNHEARIAEYRLLEQQLVDAGVTVLRNTALTLEQDVETLTLAGIDDPAFLGNTVFSKKLEQLASEEFTILLSHRPELFDSYCQNGFDLVLSGHAHGGQFRIPFLGGLIAPNQGLFPGYDSGLYVNEKTNMVVSRGLGNSLIPFRLNNPPEVILIILTNQ